MRRDNPKLPAFVPGRHPSNPMDARALYLGSRLTGSTAQTPHGQSARTYLAAASACETRQLKHEDIHIRCRLKGTAVFQIRFIEIVKGLNRTTDAAEAAHIHRRDPANRFFRTSPLRSRATRSSMDRKSSSRPDVVEIATTETVLAKAAQRRARREHQSRRKSRKQRSRSLAISPSSETPSPPQAKLPIKPHSPT